MPTVKITPEHILNSIKEWDAHLTNFNNAISQAKRLNQPYEQAQQTMNAFNVTLSEFKKIHQTKAIDSPDLINSFKLIERLHKVSNSYLQKYLLTVINAGVKDMKKK